MGCAPVALIFLLVARAATACRSTSLGVDLPDTGVTLAPGIVAVDAFVQQDSIAAILAALPNGPQWYPCPRQESSFPSKRCSKLGVDRVPALAALRTKLSATWRTLNFDRLTHVAVAMDKPSNTSSMRHAYHRDVFPERRGDAPRPSATMVIYLTAPASPFPSKMRGRRSSQMRACSFGPWPAGCWPGQTSAPTALPHQMAGTASGPTVLRLPRHRVWRCTFPSST